MGTQGYRSDYLAAFEIANHHLESIYSEYHDLQRTSVDLSTYQRAVQKAIDRERSVRSRVIPQQAGAQ